MGSLRDLRSFLHQDNTSAPLTLADMQVSLVAARVALKATDDEVACLRAHLVEVDRHISGEQCFLSL